MRNRVIIFALLSLSVFALAQPGASYHDPQNRFSLQAPAGWKTAQLNADNVQFTSGTAYATVMVLPGSNGGMFMDAIARQTGKQWHGFTEVGRGDMRLAGRAAKYVTYSGANPLGADAYLQMIAVSDQGRTFLCMFSAAKPEYTTLKGAFDKIEQSFQIAASAGGGVPPVPAGAASASPRSPASPTTAPATEAPQSHAAAAGQSNYWVMKKVSVMDEHGFERPMRALSLLVPKDWQFQGNMQYGKAVGCPSNLVTIAFRANSPDNSTSLEMFPSLNWQWSDDPNTVQMLQANNQQMARFGAQGCPVMPVMPAAEYLRREILPKARAGARVLGAEPMPDLVQEVQRKVREQEQLAAQMGLRVSMRWDVARLRIAYQLNGREMEEWLAAVTFAAGIPAPTFNIRTGRTGQAMSYSCGAAYLFGMRAPQGQLQGMERFFLMMLSTVQEEPEWQNRVTQVIAKMSADNSNAAMQRSQIIAQAGRQQSEIINRGYQERNKIQDSTAKQFDQYIRGVQSYRNPNTGETVELSNQYAHAWASGNDYLLTDSANFNPNTALRGNWTELTPVKP